MKTKVETAYNKKSFADRFGGTTLRNASILNKVSTHPETILCARESIHGTQDFKLLNGHCVANCGVGSNWMTVYLIETESRFRGEKEAQRLLQALKIWSENTSRSFQVWSPNKIVKHICEKLDINVV